MTRRILSIFLAVALVAGTVAAAPRTARAATASVTLSSNAASATNVAATIYFVSAYSATSYTVTFPSAFTLPSTVTAAAITINGTAVATASKVGSSQVSLVPAASIPAGTATIAFSSAFGLTNPPNSGSYTFAINSYGPTGNDVGTASASVSGGGSGSGSLTVTPSSTAASATNVALTISFMPTFSVTSIYFNLSGYSFVGTPSISNVYITGGTGSLSSVSGSGSSLILGFGAALTAYTTYTLTITSGAGLMNPTAANTYSITAYLSGGGSATLTGTVTIGSGSGSGSLTVTPSSTAAGGSSIYMTIGFTPSSSASSMFLSLPGFTFSSVTSASVTGGTGSTATVSGSGSSLTVSFNPALAAGYAYTVMVFGTIVNPSTAGTYTATAYVGSQVLSGTVTIGGGSGSGGLTVTPSSTAAGGTSSSMTLAFTLSSAASSMTLTMSGFTLTSITYAYVSGGSSSTITPIITGSSSLLLSFSPALAAGTYTLTIVGGILNPSTAGTYNVTAVVGSQSLYGTVTIGGTGGSVTGVSLTVYPLLPGTAAQYYVNFTTSASGSLLSGNYIYIMFPSGTSFPSTLNSSQVLVNGYAVTGALTVSGTTLTIPVPATITYAQTYFTVQIYNGLGIRNPSTNGYYNLQISTSKDTTPVASPSFQIYGTTISGLSVQANPTSRGSNPRIQLNFLTSASGYLTAGTDSIIVQFSSNVMMPLAYQTGYVTVNGTPAIAVSLVATGKLSITVPVTISGSQQIALVFDPEFGITNPSTAPATVSIQVSTSKDVSAASASYTTTTSQITQPQVALTTNGVGKASGYTVTFETGAGGALSAGSGRIYIVFPSGTTVPASIAAQNIKINGTTATIVTSSTGNRRVEVTTPVAIAVQSDVQVTIDAGAGITNPSTPRTDYTLSAYTTAEQTPVASSVYSIVNLPTTTAVTLPASPDGFNGYYKTRPTVSLTATSPSGLGVSIYYRINNGADTLYSSPVQLPEGQAVVFSYYARDTQNNQEQARQLTFKIDATAPQIVVSSPVEGSVTGTATVAFSGHTEAGATVAINSTPATAQANGDFAGTVSLNEGTNAVQVVATDLAGNVGQLRVNVTLDTKPPVLTITSPKIYSTVMTQQVTVSGKTESGATVTVGGAKAVVAADGSFSIQYMFPKEGMNVIDITATDTVGNVAKTGVAVTYVARTLIRLQVGNKTAMINDTSKTLQAAPVIVKGTTMVPLRFIGEAFGATVEWEPVFKMIRLQLGSTSIYLQVGSNYASVNGKKIVLQGLPSVIKGTTMVPLRFISEAFNAQVVWNAATKGIDITYPKP